MNEEEYLTPDEFEWVVSGGNPSLDIQWFAMDVYGRIGAFFTAGFAAIPRSAVSSLDEFNMVQREMEKLPIINDESSVEAASWIAGARYQLLRGVYIFSWDNDFGEYRPRCPYFRIFKPINSAVIDG